MVKGFLRENNNLFNMIFAHSIDKKVNVNSNRYTVARLDGKHNQQIGSNDLQEQIDNQILEIIWILDQEGQILAYRFHPD